MVRGRCDTVDDEYATSSDRATGDVLNELEATAPVPITEWRRPQLLRPAFLIYSREQEAAIITTVSKWGNELGISIPRDIASAAQIAKGTPLDVRAMDGCLVLEAVHNKSFERLLARMTPENLHGAQLADAPVGRKAALPVDQSAVPIPPHDPMQ